MQLSPHFKKSEFACKCGCGFDDINPDLITVLEDVRKHFDSPIKIDSGCRCAEHNKAVGGTANSQHLKGTAADIKVKDITPKQVADYLESIYPSSHGVGRYQTFTHIDVRPNKARWGSNG